MPQKMQIDRMKHDSGCRCHSPREIEDMPRYRCAIEKQDIGLWREGLDDRRHRRPFRGRYRLDTKIADCLRVAPGIHEIERRKRYGKSRPGQNLEVGKNA